MAGSHEVRGSIPLCSTKFFRAEGFRPFFVAFFGELKSETGEAFFVVKVEDIKKGGSRAYYCG